MSINRGPLRARSPAFASITSGERLRGETLETMGIEELMSTEETKPKEFDLKSTKEAAKEMLMKIDPYPSNPVVNNPADAWQAGFIRGARFNHENVKLVEYEAYSRLLKERDELKAEVAKLKEVEIEGLEAIHLHLKRNKIIKGNELQFLQDNVRLINENQILKDLNKKNEDAWLASETALHDIAYKLQSALLELRKEQAVSAKLKEQRDEAYYYCGWSLVDEDAELAKAREETE